jgi:hypothetical protein
MLCKFCETLDFDAASSKDGALHRASYPDLILSADGGCELCAAVRQVNDDGGFCDMKGLTEDYRIKWFYNEPGSLIVWKLDNSTDSNGEDIAMMHACTTTGEPAFIQIPLHRPQQRQ